MTKHEQRLTRAVKELTEEVRRLRHEIAALQTMHIGPVCIPSVFIPNPTVQPLMSCQVNKTTGQWTAHDEPSNY